MKLSAIVITKNEQDNIHRCLSSLTWVDEIILADSHSTDKTVEIANSFKNVKVVDTDWLGYSDTKTLAITHCAHDWILWLDADEECTMGLISEIKNILNNPASVAYKIKRTNFFMNAKVNYSGWQNDWVTRLFHKKSAHFDGNLVHEELIVKGAISSLNNRLNHYTYKSLEHYFKKFDEYTTLGAKSRYKKYKTVGINLLLIKPIARFVKHYIFKLGFLDGRVGIIISGLSAYHVFIRGLKINALIDGENKIENSTSKF